MALWADRSLRFGLSFLGLWTSSDGANNELCPKVDQPISRECSAY